MSNEMMHLVEDVRFGPKPEDTAWAPVCGTCKRNSYQTHQACGRTPGHASEQARKCGWVMHFPKPLQAGVWCCTGCKST